MPTFQMTDAFIFAPYAVSAALVLVSVAYAKLEQLVPAKTDE